MPKGNDVQHQGSRLWFPQRIKGKERGAPGSEYYIVTEGPLRIGREMKEKPIHVKQLMERVNRTITDSATELDIGMVQRPQIFDLDFMYPPHARSLRINLDLLTRSWEIDNEFTMDSHRRVLGPVVIFIKRVVRKLSAWYTNTLVHEVRRFNMVVTNTLLDMNRSIEEIRGRLDTLEKAEEERGESLTRNRVV